jgi:hypothetical protein
LAIFAEALTAAAYEVVGASGQRDGLPPMIRGRLRRHHAEAGSEGPREGEQFVEIQPGQISGLFNVPDWLRNIGLMSWLLVGVIFGTVGLIIAAPLVSAVVKISADLARVDAAERSEEQGRCRATGSRSRVAGRSPAPSIGFSAVGHSAARIAALCAILLLLVGGCGSEDATTAPEAAAPIKGLSAIYFTAGEQLEKIPAHAPGPARAAQVLLEGPGAAAADDAGTQIPAGTKLQGFEIGDDGTATLSVSPQFTSGVPAEPGRRDSNQQAELDARLAQVTYTLTQFDRVNKAEVVSGGVPVRTALDRKDFARPEPKAPKLDTGPKGGSKRASAGVRGLQERLAHLRYLPRGAVDGIDGYRTRQAVTAFQGWEGLQRDGVAGPQTMAALESAKRPRPRGGGPSRRMEVYREEGVTLLVKKGRTRRAIHTSSGAPGYTTPAGTFEIFRKEINSWSVPYQVWLPFASYFNAGIAFHAYPDVPAYPASHGCVRVPEAEAEHVYAFARIGTAVIVR